MIVLCNALDFAIVSALPFVFRGRFATVDDESIRLSTHLHRPSCPTHTNPRAQTRATSHHVRRPRRLMRASTSVEVSRRELRAREVLERRSLTRLVSTPDWCQPPPALQTQHDADDRLWSQDIDQDGRTDPMP